jgi:hypothetical protein
MQGMSVNFCYAGTKKGPHQELPTLDFGLYYDKGEIGLRVHVAGHLLHELDLLLDAVRDSFYQAIFWPAAL